MLEATLSPRKGFTIMELMVTIFIVALLASFAIYYYEGAVHEGNNSKAKSRLEVLQSGLERFKNDYPYKTLSGTFYTYGKGDEHFNEGKCDLSGDDIDVSMLAKCDYIPKISWSKQEYRYLLDDCGASDVRDCCNYSATDKKFYMVCYSAKGSCGNDYGSNYYGYISKSGLAGDCKGCSQCK
jgi:prepilin-type N-terminal cleavage/methylation domain-containing protein